MTSDFSCFGSRAEGSIPSCFLVVSGVVSLRGCADEVCKNSRILWRVVLLCIGAMFKEIKNSRESLRATTETLTPERCEKQHTEDQEKHLKIT